ncbi:MAG: hypothetical protein GXP22_01880 [Gammaproteobacteria bacterium]|nr:hypothetical protein [Gammaproteobacteria bacterium]
MKALQSMFLMLALMFFTINTASAALLYSYTGTWSRASQPPANGNLPFQYITNWEGRLVLDTTETDILSGNYDSSIVSFFEISSPQAGAFSVPGLFSPAENISFFSGSLAINGIEIRDTDFTFGWTPGIALLTDYTPLNDIFGISTTVGYGGSGSFPPFVNNWEYQGTISTVPLPPTFFLTGSGLLVLFGFARKSNMFQR